MKKSLCSIIFSIAFLTGCETQKANIKYSFYEPKESYEQKQEAYKNYEKTKDWIFEPTEDFRKYLKKISEQVYPEMREKRKG